MYSSARLIIGKPNGEKREFLFSVRPSPVAQRWAKLLKQANSQSAILRGGLWHNFPGHPFSDEQEIFSRIERAISTINKEFPGTITEHMDHQDIQGSINRIHLHFADTDQNLAYVNKKTFDAWDDLNTSLHAYESLMGSRETEKTSGMPTSFILLRWKESLLEDLDPDDYQHFTVAMKYGTVYLSYCQTGRHLFEMFLSKDDTALDHHILPLRRLSPNSILWFGTTTGPKSLIARQNAIEEWFKAREERFNRLGLYWGDPRLAIGNIPVADMIGSGSLQEESLQTVREMGNFREVLYFNTE